MLKLKEMRKVIRHHQLRPLPPRVAKKEKANEKATKAKKDSSAFATSGRQLEEEDDVYMKKSVAEKSDSQASLNKSFTGSEGSADIKGSQSEEDYGDLDYEDEGSDLDI